MPRNPPNKALKHLRVTDLRAATQLATQATRGVTRIVEGVHRAVWGTMGIPGSGPDQTRGITGWVYRAVHGVTALAGKGLETAFVKLEPLLESLVDAPPESPQREAVLAALNGVMGDRLRDHDNALATRMTLRHQGRALPLQTRALISDAKPKLLLMIHGLCMNDLQWQSDGSDGKPATDHGGDVASALGYTPLYLRYNTGLHISDNGRELSSMLEVLCTHWPVPVQEISILAHSMGGLVARSAVHCAQQETLLWVKHLKNIVFLGTPHHGAPLERAGSVLDALLGGTPFSRPFARLGHLRSPGITDLRHGNVQDADWRGRARFSERHDARHPLPLPHGVSCFTAVATTAPKRSLVSERILGDGLVPLPSALGQHKDPAHCLDFPKSAQWVGYRMNHWDLLRSPEVTRKIVRWLGDSR